MLSPVWWECVTGMGSYLLLNIPPSPNWPHPPALYLAWESCHAQIPLCPILSSRLPFVMTRYPPPFPSPSPSIGGCVDQASTAIAGFAAGMGGAFDGRGSSSGKVSREGTRHKERKNKGVVSHYTHKRFCDDTGIKKHESRVEAHFSTS